MSEDNIHAQASQVNDLLASEGISQFIEHDPLKPFKRPGESTDDAVNSFVDTARSIREADSRSPSNRHPESRYEPSDEGGQIDTPAAPPSRFQSPQDVQNAAAWLGNELQKVEHLFQSNQITKGQYDQALANANAMANEIHHGHLSMRERELQMRDHVENIHNQISQLIPEWGDTKGRAKIQDQILNFYSGYGIPIEAIQQVSHPQVIAGMHSLMKEVHQARAAKSKQLQQLRARQNQSRQQVTRETNNFSDIGSQVSAAGDILRAAGVF